MLEEDAPTSVEDISPCEEDAWRTDQDVSLCVEDEVRCEEAEIGSG